MANSTITNYLSDPSIPAETRRKIAEGINTGKLTEGTAVQGISAKYGSKYGSTEASSPAGEIAKKAIQTFNPANLASNVGGIVNKLATKAPEIGKALADIGSKITPEQDAINKANTEKSDAEAKAKVDQRGKDVGYLNSKGIVPDSTRSNEEIQSRATNESISSGDILKRPFENAVNNTVDLAKQGLITGGEGIQKVGAAITGDTSNLEGFRSFYGIKSPEQAGRDMKQLNPEERGQIGGEGLQNFVSGTVGTAFSPIMGATEAIPGGKEAMNAVNDYAIKPVVQAGSGQLKNTLRNMGVQLNPEQEASIDEGVGNILNLFMAKAGEDSARAKSLDIQKGELAKSIPEMIKNGDLEGAKSAMSQYEKAMTEHTTATGRVGAAVGDGMAVAGTKVAEGGKTVGTRVMEAIQKDPEAVLNKTIDAGIQRGVRPSVAGKATAETQAAYKVKAREGVKTIIENKNDLKLTDASSGEIIHGELPKNLTQFSEAIQQAKKKVYQKYSEMSQRAGEEGVKVNLNDIATELDKVASDQVLQDSNPSAAKYAAEKADILRNRGNYTPEQAEQALKIYNDSLQNFYRNPTPDTYAKAHVDALVANHLRTGLDNVVDSLDDTRYADLKRQYGSLKTIEKDVNHRAVVDSRQNQVGLVDSLTNVASAAEAINGLVNMNPQAFATGLAMKGIAKYIKYINDPNVIVRKMFSKGETYLNKAKEIPSLTSETSSSTPRSFSTTNPAKTDNNISPAKLDYTPAKTLSTYDRKIETKFGDYLSKHFDDALVEYQSEFGNVINTDNVRELSKDYAKNNATRAELASAVHEPSSAFTKKMLNDTIDMNPDSDLPLTGTAGGAGVGKSTAVNDALGNISNQSLAVYDTNMNSATKASVWIDKALEKNIPVKLAFVWREAGRALTNALSRADKAGRTVPLGAFVKSHIESLEAIKDLYQKYNNNKLIEFNFVDNDGGFGDAKKTDFDFIKNKKYDSTILKEQLTQQLNQAYNDGKITKTTYEGFKKDFE